MLTENERYSNRFSGTKILLIVYAIWFTLDFLSCTKYIDFETNLFAKKIFSYSGYIKYILILYVFLSKKHTLKQWIGIFIVLFILFISALKAEYVVLFSAGLFIFSCERQDTEKLIKLTAIISSAYIIITVLLALTGVIENYVVFRYEGGNARYGLGFTHPNTFSYFVFITILTVIWLRDFNIKIIDLFLFSFLIVLIWIVPNSRMCCCAIVFSISVSVLKKIYDNRTIKTKKNILFGMTGIAMLCNILSVVLSFMYKPSGIFHTINQLLSGRLFFNRTGIDYFGVSWLGQVVQRYIDEPPGQIILDNAYMLVLLKYGILSYLILSFMTLAAMIYESRKLHYKNVAVMMILAVYAITEQNVLFLFQNVFFVLLASPLFDTSEDLRCKTIFNHIRDCFKEKSTNIIYKK